MTCHLADKYINYKSPIAIISPELIHHQISNTSDFTRNQMCNIVVLNFISSQYYIYIQKYNYAVIRHRCHLQHACKYCGHLPLVFVYTVLDLGWVFVSLDFILDTFSSFMTNMSMHGQCSIIILYLINRIKTMACKQKTTVSVVVHYKI